MIDKEFFIGFPFPWMLRSVEGALLAHGDGCLFAMPANAIAQDELDFLLKQETPGWKLSPSGYASYMSALSPDSGIWLGLYGLKVQGKSTALGKLPGLSIKTQPSAIEAYVKRTLAALAASKEKMNKFMRQNIHEIRGVNADIYNAVYNLKTNVSQNGYDHTRDYRIIRNIEELSQFLTTRTSVLDVVSNPSFLQANRSQIPVYRAFDRIVRSLQPTAVSRSIQLGISGSSESKVLGVPLFDVIPYLLIQNALKYAPKDSRVEVNIVEDEQKVYMNIMSMGPKVEEDELEKIFLSGFRGKRAARIAEGTGTGLYIVKLLVAMHNDGFIQFSQEGVVTNIDGMEYVETSIQVAMGLFA